MIKKIISKLFKVEQIPKKIQKSVDKTEKETMCTLPTYKHDVPKPKMKQKKSKCVHDFSEGMFCLHCGATLMTNHDEEDVERYRKEFFAYIKQLDLPRDPIQKLGKLWGEYKKDLSRNSVNMNSNSENGMHTLYNVSFPDFMDWLQRRSLKLKRWVD